MARYDFTQLSGLDFEEIARDLVNCTLHRCLPEFGTLLSTNLRCSFNASNGVFLQCYHHPENTWEVLIHKIRMSNYAALSHQGVRHLILCTSLLLSADHKQSILMQCGSMASALVIADEAGIARLLEAVPSVEQRHFKLRLARRDVLERIHQGSTSNATHFPPQSIYSSLRRYVQNHTYIRAANVLEQRNAVLISGPPGVGKTTVANLLLYSLLAEGYTPVIVREDLSDARSRFAPNLRQVFYFDDFLGLTFLGDRGGGGNLSEDPVLLNLIALIKDSPRAKLILTTRSNVLAAAISHGGAWSRHQVLESDSMIEADNYSPFQRARILYNHIWFSKLELEYRQQLVVDDFHLEILRHSNFNPRLIEATCEHRVAQRTSAAEYRSAVLRDLDNPGNIWLFLFENRTSQSARSALLALTSFGTSCPYDKLLKAWEILHQIRGHTPGSFDDALKELEGSFVKIEGDQVAIMNPSVRDAMAAVLAREHHLADLVWSARFFSQLYYIWSLSQYLPHPKLKSLLKKNSNLVLAVTRSLLKTTPFRPNRCGGWIGGWGACSPGTRFWTIVGMADALSHEPLWTAANSLRRSMMDDWKQFLPEFQLVTYAIAFAQSTGKAVTRLRDRTMWSLLDHLPKGTAADFYRVWRHSGRWPSSSQERYLRKLRTVFIVYADSYLMNEVEHCRTAVELGIFLSNISPLVQMCQDEHISRLMSSLHRRAARIEADESLTVPHREQIRPAAPMVEPELDDIALRSMFRSLL